MKNYLIKTHELKLIFASNGDPRFFSPGNVHNFLRRIVFQIRVDSNRVRVHVHFEPIQIPNKRFVIFSDTAQKVFLILTNNRDTFIVLRTPRNIVDPVTVVRQFLQSRVRVPDVKNKNIRAIQRNHRDLVGIRPVPGDSNKGIIRFTIV